MEEEKKWLKEARKGDKESFGLLYEKYGQQIFRFIYWQVSNKEQAEDLNQEVFLKAWKNIEKYQERNCPFSSWLYRIARNTVIDFYRTQKKVYPIEDEIFFSGGDDLRENPKKIAETKIEIERVKKVLNSLPNNQREIIILKFIEGFSNKEIAKILKKSEGAIRILQYRAIKNLKKIL